MMLLIMEPFYSILLKKIEYTDIKKFILYGTFY